MADTMSSLPLQQLIATINTRQLPVVLQVCSGIYFQGSVYELSGSEVCFSTGDLVKVTGLTLISVNCEDTISGQISELPLNSKGVFKQFPEGRRYLSLKDMLGARSQGTGNPGLPFSFISRCELTVDALVMGPGTVMVAHSVEAPRGEGGTGRMLCRMSGSQGGSVRLVLPLSCQGEFYECFSLQEIMSRTELCRGLFCSVDAIVGAERPLILRPVYEVEARMHLRKDTVRFPSSLEVDVVEVTDQPDDMAFIAPLTLDELLTLPDDTFPATARIVETPTVDHLVQSGWVEELRGDQELILHGKGSVSMALFSSARRIKRQYFLVSEGYGGRFRRRPREFLSVFEVYVASTQAPGLRVTVTRSVQEAEDDVSGLVVGEELEVVGHRIGAQEAQQSNPKHSADVLICRRIEELSDDEEEAEGGAAAAAAILELPLHWHGFFREVISNNKKYKIKDLCQQFSLPLNVKVVSRDADLAADPLYGISSLRLECVTVENFIQASFPTSPEYCFTIPIRCLSMVVYFTQESLPWPRDEPPVVHVEVVTEVTESFYLEKCRLIYSQQPPPPRPPKHNLSLAVKVTPKPCIREPLADSHPARSANGSEPEEGLRRQSVPCKAKVPLPLPKGPRKPALPSPKTSCKPQQSVQPKGNPYEACRITQGEVQSEDSDHDYESADLIDTIKKMQEFVSY
ncbi:unnamed protein product [Gadus morhua 'NCC']